MNEVELVKYQKLKRECKIFLRAVEGAITRINSDTAKEETTYCTKETAAVRRASMEMTRMLADYRQGRL